MSSMSSMSSMSMEQAEREIERLTIERDKLIMREVMRDLEDYMQWIRVRDIMCRAERG